MAVKKSPGSAVGFTVKSGWAASVLLTGPANAPRLVDSRRIELSDPADPEARQPYHAGFGTARVSGAELTRLVSSVRRFGRHSAASLLREYEHSGHQLRGAGIIVGSLIDPNEIANDHIRIHALEGQLFRRIVEEAAAKRGLTCSVWRERDVLEAAIPILQKPPREVEATLRALGQELDGPWRVEQKRAALAAWLILARRT